MKYLNITVLFFSFFIMPIQLCYAGDKEKARMVLASQLSEKFLAARTVLDESDLTTVKQGDFNGDGIKDIAVVFLPVLEIKSTNKIKVQRLWENFSQSDTTKYHKSIAIFHGSKAGWLSDATQVSVLLAGDGTLEVPAFELLSARVGGEDYQLYYNYRAV